MFIDDLWVEGTMNRLFVDTKSADETINFCQPV